MKTKKKKDKKQKEQGTDLIKDGPILANSSANGAIANDVPLEIHHGDIKAESRKIKNDSYEKGVGPPADRARQDAELDQAQRLASASHL